MSTTIKKQGVCITIRKSVRNNWHTIEHRSGKPSVDTTHESRQAAVKYAESVS